MRAFILLCFLSLVTVACNSARVNDAKLNVSSKVSSSVEKFLNQEAQERDISFPDHSCPVEFAEYAHDIEKFINKVLKAKEEQEIIASKLSGQKSVVSTSVRALCFFAADLAKEKLPALSPKNRCLIALGYDEGFPLIQQACSRI